MSLHCIGYVTALYWLCHCTVLAMSLRCIGYVTALYDLNEIGYVTALYDLNEIGCVTALYDLNEIGYVTALYDLNETGCVTALYDLNEISGPPKYIFKMFILQCCYIVGIYDTCTLLLNYICQEQVSVFITFSVLVGGVVVVVVVVVISCI